jgi:hypothetical protein
MALAFLAACLSSLIASQPIANQPAFAREVGGRVIDAISGAPIADITVMLSPTMFPPGAAGPLQAITDENGTFRFQRLAAGRYRLQAQRPGFAALAGPFDERALDVAAGQTITGLELALRPSATIAGRYSLIPSPSQNSVACCPPTRTSSVSGASPMISEHSRVAIRSSRHRQYEFAKAGGVTPSMFTAG